VTGKVKAVTIDYLRIVGRTATASTLTDGINGGRGGGAQGSSLSLASDIAGDPLCDDDYFAEIACFFF
jgi:hypothetical protein